MRNVDRIRFAYGSISSQPIRSGLTALGITVGIAAVVVLTSIGEGVRLFVLSEFTQFGTTVLGVTPGRKSTFGASVGIFGSDRPLTIEDAEALRRLPYVVATEGIVQGNAAVEHGQRSRRTTVLGVGSDMPRILRFAVEMGNFLPDDDPTSPRPFAVLGSKLCDELFAGESPLGRRVRIAGSRYRVLGVMESKGQFLGFDLDDAIYIPAARGLELFDRDSLMEIHVFYGPEAPVDELVSSVRSLLMARHDREDFTITTQDQMLATLDDILNILKLSVGALGAISLFVGAVGIFTIMTIAVRERTAEVGLLRTLGARRGQILAIFLTEATALATLGGLSGLIIGSAVGIALSWAVPALPTHTPWLYALAAVLLAAAVGLTAGALPASRAARLDPIESLRAE